MCVLDILESQKMISFLYNACEDFIGENLLDLFKTDFEFQSWSIPAHVLKQMPASL